ncbi:MAG TPA: PTS system mannose/fructose/sorbose family transporter subunit IID [Pseudonocardiaceae bacterium]
MSDTIERVEAAPPAEQPAIPRSVLNRSFWRYFWSFQISWNYERMQALGFCWAMIPVLRYLNSDDRSFAEAMQRHLAFFNTSPIVGGPFILGSTIAMEESGSGTSAEGVKVAMMGPLAGIGDALTFALYNTFIFTFASNWAIEGHLYGPIFAAVMVLVPYFVVRRWQFTLGYTQGKSMIMNLASGAFERFQEGLIVLGLIVLGGFIPSIVKIVTTLHITGKAPTGGKPKPIAVQDQIDKLLPFLLPVLVTALIYFLLRRFRMHPIWAIVILFAIGLGLGSQGWFIKPPAG